MHKQSNVIFQVKVIDLKKKFAFKYNLLKFVSEARDNYTATLLS